MLVPDCIDGSNLEPVQPGRHGIVHVCTTGKSPYFRQNKTGYVGLAQVPHLR